MKYEVRKLHEVVVEPMQRIDDQNQDVEFLHSKVEREKEVSKTLKNTVSVVARNLQLREKELQIHRQRAEEQHARNKQQVKPAPIYSQSCPLSCCLGSSIVLFDNSCALFDIQSTRKVGRDN